MQWGLAKYATQSKEALAKTAAFQTQFEKVYCHCEQGRKERKSIERVEGKIVTWTICKGDRMS